MATGYEDYEDCGETARSCRISWIITRVESWVTEIHTRNLIPTVVTFSTYTNKSVFVLCISQLLQHQLTWDIGVGRSILCRGGLRRRGRVV